MWRKAGLVGCLVFLLLVGQIGGGRFPTPVVQAASTTIVISQFQVAGATATDEFIELHNVGSTSVDLTGYRVVYRSATGTSDTTLYNWTASTVIPAGGYYLLGNTGYVGATTANVVYSSGSMAAAGGGLAIRNGAANTGTIIDSVGFGTATNAYVETTATAAPAANTSQARALNGCTDTDNNLNNFAVLNPSAPRNAATAVNLCSSGPSLTINDVTVTEGNSGTTLASFTVSLSVPAGAGGVTFDIATADNTATVANGDYVARSLTGQTIPQGSQTYTFDVTVNGDTNVEGAETWFVNITNVTGATVADGQGQGTITTDDVGLALIHDIQGSGAQSPLVGQAVTLEGVVVGDYQGATGLSGFFIQEEDAQIDADPATSEGVFVYDGTFGVAVNVGDVVRVQGTAVEYLTTGVYLTEISTVTQVTVMSSGASVTPATVNLPVTAQTDLERYEGMRVTLPQTLTVADNYSLGYYGEVGLAAGGRVFNPTNVITPGAPAIALQTANDLRRIVLDDGRSGSNPDPVVHPAPGLGPFNTLRAGDTLPNLNGVLDQRFGIYRVQPIGSINFTAANPRPTTPPAPGGTLKVMSGNLLNYFTTIDTGTGVPRGADSAIEFTRQRDKLINVLIAVNADVVGAMELENNTTTAIQDLINGLNAVAGAGTYSYINTGVLGTDVIRVAVIYKPGTVTPVGSYLTDLNTIFSRPPVAQTFQHISTGETFTVVVNHFNSKGCSGATGLDLDQGDGQGCYNNRRTQQATQLISFINTTVIPTSGDSDVLIIGDLNAYAKEDPITTLLNAGYTNLVERFNGAEAYSYAFDGQIGYLDHALASASLVPQVADTADWHINADEPIDLDYNDDVITADEYAADVNQASLYDSGPFRASDHDPILIGLNLLPLGTADFSDLAGSYGIAWHRGPHAVYLGATVSNDSSYATGDDNASDDGVTRFSGQWRPDQTVTLRVQVTGGSGWLTGWIDWNADGDFADTGEKAVNQAVSVGANTVNVTVPAGALVGLGSTADLAARFRLYESATEPARPTAPDVAVASNGVTGGEVEDYVWSFGPLAITLSDLNARSAANPIGWGLPLGVMLIAGVVVWRRVNRQ